MKVALVHDYLNQYGGAERVLETLIEIFPEAPIYTLFYDKKRTLGRFEPKTIKTSFLDFPLVRNRHRLFIPALPLAAQSINIGDDYDLIISDTAGYAKGIRYGRKNKLVHISYIHTPLRYAWETENYIEMKFNNKLVRKVINFWVKPVAASLRKWDYQTAQKPDILIANSNFIANKIKKYYGREAQTMYPPVDTEKFFYELPNNQSQSYYLAVGRLMHYKRFDLIVRAFSQLKFPLKIVGTGPEFKNLIALSRRLKSENIEFVNFSGDNELRQFYNNAKALIFPQVEDFGLVAAEAQICGLPVIAYNAGGATEIVQNGKTGILFEHQTIESLISAIKQSEDKNWNRQFISNFAQKFSKDEFRKRFMDIIKNQNLL